MKWNFNTHLCIDMGSYDTFKPRKTMKAERVPIDNNTCIENDPRRVLLIDINIKKTWMAYITEEDPDRVFYDSEFGRSDDRRELRHHLTVSEFKEAKTRNIRRYSFDITGLFQPKADGTCIFLSISPDGKRIALSFMTIDEYGFSNDEAPNNPNCLIFKMKNNESSGVELRLDESIKFQGRAVFSKNNNLLLINKKVLQVYDSAYHKTHWYNLRPLGTTSIMKIRQNIHILDYMQDPPWTWYFDGTSKVEFNDIKDVVSMSRHIRHNILVTSYEKRAQIWSITENGTLLTSILKEKHEEIMAFTNNYKFLATFNDSKKSINIYNMKSGLIVYRLRPKEKTPEGKKFEVSYIRFCREAKYLLMTGVEKDLNGSLDATISFELWHMESEQSIYLMKKAFSIPQDRNGNTDQKYQMLQPFVKNDDGSLDSTLNDSEISNTPAIDETTSGYDLERKSDFNVSNFSEGVTSLGTSVFDMEYTFKGFYVDFLESDGLTKVESVKIDIYQEDILDSCSYNQIYDERIWAIPQSDESQAQNSQFSNNHYRFDWKRVNDNVSSNSNLLDEVKHPTDFRNSVCYVRRYDDQLYLLRFGKHLVELWRLSEFSKPRIIIGSDEEITEDTVLELRHSDELLFIHAYKPSEFGFYYTFRESWSLIYNDESSIKVTKTGKPEDISRFIINTEMDPNDDLYKEDISNNNQNDDYKSDNPDDPDDDMEDDSDNEEENRTQLNKEELFIPFHQLVKNEKLSKNHLHICLRSACQALHYLHNIDPSNETKKNYNKLFDKTQVIIRHCIEKITHRKPQKYKYFSTISGSNILAMLSSFREGRIILYQLLKNEKIPISLFSYPRKLTIRQFNENLSTNENALTVLIEEMSYDLYKLLFNRILSDSKETGIGCLSVLTDALIYLQEISNNDLLLSSSQKLSYLKIDMQKSHISEEEARFILNMNVGSKDYIPNMRMLEPYSSREQITQYTNHVLDHIRYSWTNITKYNDSYWISDLFCDIRNSSAIKTLKRVAGLNLLVRKFIKTRRYIIKEIRKSHNAPGKLAALCVVPLPHFLSYSDFPEDRINDKTLGSYDADSQSEVIPYKSESAFVRIATNQNENSIFRQGNTILEVLIRYKWNQYIWYYFFIMYFVCIVYYLSFFIGVCFSSEIFNYKSSEDPLQPGQKVCFVLMFLSIFVLVFQEFRQLKKSYNKIAYLTSLYNWIDWTTFALSIVSFWLMLTGHKDFEAVNSIAVLFVWFHAIVKLRVFSLVGIALETTIQLIRSVKGILLIMLLVIFAFTNSYISLLSNQDDEFFQEQYAGSVNLTDSGIQPEGTVEFGDVSAQNDFNDVFKSFSMLWFFLYGIWDPIFDGDVGDSKMVLVLSILYSFITVLIFFNILIAYMNSSIEDVKKRGKKAWISHFAAVVAEMEQLWCLPSVKKVRRFNPTYIYYIAHIDKINEKKDILSKETDDLIRKLAVVYSTEVHKGRKPAYEVDIDDLKNSLQIESKILADYPDINPKVLDLIKLRDQELSKKLDNLKESLPYMMFVNEEN